MFVLLSDCFKLDKEAMINNFEKIRSILEFRSEDDFYFLQILQRKKDHKNTQLRVTGANNNSRLIRMYTIRSLEYFDHVTNEIIELCDLFQARAGINLNRRSFEKIAFHTLKKVTDQILNGDFTHTNKAYASVCGTYSNESDKKWILDIDEPLSRKHNEMILFAERECRPDGSKFVTTIPSKSGCHIIMRPFDLQRFKQEYPDIEIHKDNPTNLYIP